MNTNLTIIENNFWTDIWPIYQSNILSKTHIPTFELLYMDYQIQVWNESTTMTKDIVDESLYALKNGSLDLKFLDMPIIEPKPEIELFNHLLEKNLVFSLKKEIYNMPFKEIW